MGTGSYNYIDTQTCTDYKVDVTVKSEVEIRAGARINIGTPQS